MKITGVTPWLLYAPAAYRDGRKGEYIFVEVTTDEGVTGWGEVTTTYPVANRAICAVLQQLGELIEGDDPAPVGAENGSGRKVLEDRFQPRTGDDITRLQKVVA